MKKVYSTQANIKFIYCKSPVTIDKSKEWGDGNFQNFPYGVFLKINDSDNTISHGVQPNADNTAPIGWTKNEAGTYNKFPIWVDDTKIYKENEVIEINTLDGFMKYCVKQDSIIVCNGLDYPQIADSWVMSVRDLEKNYNIKL